MSLEKELLTFLTTFTKLFSCTLKRLLLIWLFGVIFITPAASQNLSTEGTDFWFGFMDNWLQSSGNPIILEIYISADDTTEGVLEMPLVQELDPIEFTVIPGNTTLLTVPAELAKALGSKSKENKGIHITTEKDVSVYAMNKRQYSADVAVILPTFSLSNNYLVMAHWENGNRNNNDNSDSEFLIVATEDNTEIEITPTRNLEGGGSAGVPFRISLNGGETYQVQARGDLTGTKIVGLDNQANECNNFAVFAGNQYTKVGQCDHPDGHDHLYEQMYPIKTWGTEYTVVDFETRIGGDIVKVLASEDRTTVNISGQNFTIDEGEFIVRTLEGVNTITSDKPIAVGQFSRSQGCDGTRGDPFFIMISPDEQLLRSITFNAPTIATVTNYSLNVITPTSDVPNVRFDGANIQNLFLPVPGNSDMSYARVITSSGDHTLNSEEGFISYIYGYGSNESFGYATGAGLANLSLGVDIRNQIGVTVPVDSICLHDVSVFTPFSSFEFDTYRYDFGDGTIVSRSDKTPVPHQYSQPGTYIFRLVGLDDQDNCSGGSEETEVKVIKVINPALQVRGPRSVCPNTPGVDYFIENNIYYQNTWFVEGGTVVSNSNDSIRIDWGATNNQAKIKVVSTNRYNCNGDTVIYPVRINIKLAPEAPFGSDSLCASFIQDIPYNTYFTQGSIYDWKIENGEIISGQGSNEIRVNWFSEGYGKLWFDQMAQTDTVCDGTSDTLQVFIQRVPNPVASISSVKNVYQIEEPITLSFSADTLLQLGRLIMNGVPFADSLDLDNPLSLSFECGGVYNFQLEAFDTVGICQDIAFGEYTLTVLNPLIEIIHVTHDLLQDSTLNIAWSAQFVDFKTDPLILERLGESRIALDTLLESTGIFTESSLGTSSTSYEYQIRDSGPCTNEYQSRIHHSMVLSVSQPEDEDEAVITWNPYEGWETGISNYELERSIDGQEWTSIAQLSDEEYVYLNDTLGFDYCFRVRANEAQGNLSYAYSNVACAFFIPPLFPYNLITPNGDGLNDQFIIRSVELYPNSKLTIFNRWGRIVLEQKAYQNDWEGTENGKDLSSGVYFYVLEINDPRIEFRQINGVVSIMR